MKLNFVVVCIFLTLCGLSLAKDVLKTNPSGTKQRGGNSSTKETCHRSVRLIIYTPSDETAPSADVCVPVEDKTYLVDVLDEAVKMTLITYEYELQKYGIYITSMEGYAAKSQLNEYWAILNTSGSYLPVGASCYQTKWGEEIVFRIETYKLTGVCAKGEN